MTMPRSLWNGTIAFGLVRVPVKLHSATESKRIPFRERHLSDGGAIEHRRVCVKEGKEVPYSEIVKGFEVSAGSYVVLSKEEISVADGPDAHVVDIEHFVNSREIDPMYYERTYYLSPGKLGEEPYRLLHAALERSGRVGIGRFVFHNKAHLVAIRALQGVIALHTMRFADELVADSELDPVEPDQEPSKLELDTAQLLIDQLDSTFEPDSYDDTYREAVLALIDRKARGEAIEAPERELVTREGDLLATLQASLEDHGGRSRRAKRGTPRDGGSPDKTSSPSSRAHTRGDR
jgi:DNA end-binding protein Ku